MSRISFIFYVIFFKIVTDILKIMLLFKDLCVIFQYEKGGENMKKTIAVSIDKNILDLLEYTNIGRKIKLNRSQIFERAVREYMATNWKQKAQYKKEKERKNEP